MSQTIRVKCPRCGDPHEFDVSAFRRAGIIECAECHRHSRPDEWRIGWTRKDQQMMREALEPAP